jgi:peptide/nickel transport system permease protein
VFAYIVRRLFQGALVILVVSIITFAIFFVLPQLLGENLAATYAGKAASPTEVKGIGVKLGFDQPLYTQYWSFLKAIFVGRTYGNGSVSLDCPAPCFGYSYITNQLVWPKLIADFPVTFSLAIGAGLIWLFSGVVSGVVAALNKGKFLDRAVIVVALAGISMPVNFTALVVALLVQYQFHIIDQIQYVPFTQDPVQWAWNLLFPWLVLAFISAASYARITRSTMLDTLSDDYVRTARAKGLRERTVIGKHAMRSIYTPIITMFGLDFGYLLGGALVTEFVFSLHGIGYDVIDAIGRQDIQIVMGVTLMACGFIVAANLVVDLLYGVLDPRVRVS